MTNKQVPRRDYYSSANIGFRRARKELQAFADTVQARALDLCKAVEQGDLEGIALIASALRDESTAVLALAQGEAVAP